MKALILLLCCFVASPTAALAEWVRATGSYIFPPVVTEAEACQQAESRATADAIRQMTGETLSSEETMRCTEQGDQAECARNSSVWTAVGGEIRSIRDRSMVTTIEMESFRKCTVSFDADVHVAAGKPDPNFDIGVSLNTSVFRSGEALSVALKPSQPMAVQIFQWLPYEKGDAQVSRIFPNAFDPVALLDKPTAIPTAAGGKRYDLTITFPSSMPPSRKMVDEYLMVVATKNPIAFLDSYSLENFNRAVAEIPVGDRRIVRREYNIIRGP